MAEFDDFGLLAQMARRQLIHLLEMMPEVKDIILDPTLMRFLDKIASMSLLQQHNCAHIQQLSSSTQPFWGEHSLRRVYIVRPSAASARLISEHILAEPQHQYSVIFVPNRLYLCEIEFEHNGVFGLIDIYDLDMPLISIDSHLFSLEHPDFAYSILVDQTFTHLRCVAKSLWQLQSLYGLIPTVYGVGTNSVNINLVMKKMFIELGEPRSSPDQPVSHLFLLDRNLDLTTVLLTGLTYESTLHDMFDINCGKVTFGEEVEKRLKSGDDGKLLKVVTLDNNDAIFAVIRNMHMTAVFPFLSAKAKSLQASYDKGSRLDQVKDMKEFVSNELKSLKEQHKLLEMHICACEVLLENSKGLSERLNLEHSLVSGEYSCNEVMTYLEDTMCQQKNKWQVLLLACLWSVCQNGIPSKYYLSFRRQFLHAYGYEYHPIFHYLSLRGVLVDRGSSLLSSIKIFMPSSNLRPTFQFLSRQMNLLPVKNQPPLDLRNPDQMRYVFSGAFTPPLCQLVADTVNNGWNMSELKKTFGESVFCDQNSYMPANRPLDSRIRKAILVYFIGGVTYAEIAALTLLAQHNNFRIIIATTNIIHRERFIKELANVNI